MTSRKCTYPGCENPFRAQGFCVSHYNKARRSKEKIPAGYIDPEEFWQWVKKELNIA